MGIWPTSTAIALGLVMGVMGFMIYHKQTTLPLADVMQSQSNTSVAGELSYTLLDSRILITNTSSSLQGILTIPISYDPNSIQLKTDQITSKYDYSFDTSKVGSLTIFVNGQLEVGQLISIPLIGESSNISIASPRIVSNNTTHSLSITRID